MKTTRPYPSLLLAAACTALLLCPALSARADNRETNTILSKTSGVGELGLKITALGLEIKANIERIREQVLNIE